MNKCQIQSLRSVLISLILLRIISAINSNLDICLTYSILSRFGLDENQVISIVCVLANKRLSDFKCQISDDNFR